MSDAGRFKVGDLVSSTNGRDEGHLYLIWAIDDDGWLMLADGRTRRIENPKRKNPKHARSCQQSAVEIAQKILAGQNTSNLELRKAIAELGNALGEDQE